MAPSPAPWAVLGDVLWCLGLGCLLGAARDAVRLALGEGPVRCFFRDIAVFAAAAVLVCGFAAGASAGGLARWYMSAAKQKNLLKSKNPPKNGCKNRRKYYIISHT